MMDFEIVESLRQVYKVPGKFLNGRIFYLCDLLARNRLNLLQDCSTAYTNPSDQVKNSHGSAGPVQTRRGFLLVSVRSKLILPDPCKPGLRSLILCLNGRNIGEKL